ncbi:YdeI/OmpD-associated family protein [Pseudonocardia sp. KRD-291]|nr:YdeI/OmpD-associated family protein [Pseudonocardia sp. KRD291]
MLDVLVADRAQWRAWLCSQSGTAEEIWLVIPHARHRTPENSGISHREAIEEALCVGWIDSHARRYDEYSMIQRFGPRGPRSTWSKVNREIVERLETDGLMTPAGRAVVDLARRTGTWSVLAEAQDGVVPDDLREHLAGDAASFDALSPSARRTILEWIARAKRPETRRRRIARVAECGALCTTPPELNLRTRVARP